MLNHQLIKTDAQGRLLAVLDDPVDFNGGTPTKDGLLCVSEVDGQVFVNGLGYTDLEHICAEQSVTPPSGNPFAGPTGRARINQGPPAFWLYGLPFTVDGLLCVVIGDVPPPVEEFAFDNAFDNSFDSESAP